MSHHDKPSEHMPHAGDAAVPTAEAGEAVSHLGQDDADDAHKGERRNETGGRRPAPGSGGIASGLQPGGTSPGGGPGASVGSIGTGGGATGGAPSGGVKKSGT